MLKEGRIREKWQQSKVVFIPKPNKGHQAAKGWRPINLRKSRCRRAVGGWLIPQRAIQGYQEGGQALEAMTPALTRVQ